MEHELRALRIQIREKSTVSFKLQKEVSFLIRSNDPVNLEGYGISFSECTKFKL